MKKLVLMASMIACNAFAVDTYNASNGQLTIPSVNVGTSVYNNVVVTVGSVLSVGSISTSLVATSKPTQNIEGFWAGNTSSGTIYYLFLDNGEYWSTFGSSYTDGSYVPNIVYKGAYNVIDNLEFNYYGSNDNLGKSTNGYGVGTIISSERIETQFNNKITPLTPIDKQYWGLSQAISKFDYSSKANINDIIGVWSVSYLSGYKGVINVAQDGSFTGNTNTCNFRGVFTPRISGSNVFSVTLFNNNACGFANGQDISGVAITYITVNGKRQLLTFGSPSGDVRSEIIYSQR